MRQITPSVSGEVYEACEQIAERTGTRAQARGTPAHSVVEFSLALMSHPTVKLVWVDETLHIAALSLLEQRTDKNYSLCDAVSFVLMRNHAIQGALTTDRHFVQEDFVKLLED